jgi:hypothetical protein
MVHDAGPVNCVPHVLELWNGPLAVTAMPVSSSPPLLVKVTVCADESAPTAVEAKLSEAGLRLSVAGDWPVPLSAIVCVPPEYTSVKVPAAAPAWVGENSSCIWQLVCAARLVVPQESVAIENGPLTVRLVIGVADVLLLFTVISSSAEA